MNEEMLKELIRQGEGYFVEFKKALNSDLAKEIVAFANSSGGRIFLGIGDDGTVHGIDINNSIKSRIQDIAEQCDPPVRISVNEIEGRVLVVNVEESRLKPHRTTSGFYLRAGANSQKMNTDTIIEFLEKEERIKFDERVRYDIDFEEAFDENAWEEFIQLSDIREPVHKTNILRSLKAVVVENDRMYLTNAGVLFFTKSPSKYIPQAPVRCIAFKTDERTEIYDTKTFDENIISMIKSGVSFIERYTYSSRIIEGTEAKNKPELPTVALREAVVNAVIHRDYFETGANVVIEIFPRKIKITNPGGLPKGMHPEEFGEFSLARNPLTASIMQHTPYMEKFGTGISRIRKQLKDAGLKQALFEFRNFFSLTFFRDEPSREDVRHDEPLNEPSRENVRYDEPLSEPSRENVRHDEPLSVTDFEMQVLAIIHNNNEITKAELAEQTGKSRASVTRAVKQLRLNNLLSSKGRGRNFVWIVNE